MSVRDQRWDGVLRRSLDLPSRQDELIETLLTIRDTCQIDQIVTVHMRTVRENGSF